MTCGGRGHLKCHKFEQKSGVLRNGFKDFKNTDDVVEVVYLSCAHCGFRNHDVEKCTYKQANQRP